MVNLLPIPAIDPVFDAPAQLAPTTIMAIIILGTKDIMITLNLFFDQVMQQLICMLCLYFFYPNSYEYKFYDSINLFKTSFTLNQNTVHIKLENFIMSNHF
jgi:hypothetical protein